MPRILPKPVIRRISLSGDPWRTSEDLRDFHDAHLTKIPGMTSGLCPTCFEQGKSQKRMRRFELCAPLSKSKCDPLLPVHEPRVSAKHQWWNRGLIRWLVAPSANLPWFECREFATCPKCGTDRVKENDYVRQFGRIRLILFWIEGRLPWKELKRSLTTMF